MSTKTLRLPPKLPAVIYTDGGCALIPDKGGAGGWCAIITIGDDRKVLTGFETGTTNNRMEMMACIKALEYLPVVKRRKVTLTTDSQYVRNGLTIWFPTWVKRGWVTYDGDPVKNRDLWERLDAAAWRHDLTVLWVKGHAGNEMNEMADMWASAMVKDAKEAMGA